jgi:hypothetical protein
MPPPERPAAPLSLFYSYSSRDGALRDELETHLTLLRRQGFISGWHDRRVEAGTEWERQIDQHLNAADIILLLVSADFLASDYCYDLEMTRALERHGAGAARVIPVILRPCDWQSAPFGKLQAQPKGGKPVTSWRKKDEAFTDIARGIREAVVSLAAGAQNPQAPAQSTPVGTPSAEQPQNVERAALVRMVSDLSPSHMSRLVTLIEGASPHLRSQDTVPEQVADLIRWVTSPQGPGLEAVREAMKKLRHDIYLGGETPAFDDPEAPQRTPPHLSLQPPLGPGGIAPEMELLDVLNCSGQFIRVSYYEYEPGNNKAGDPKNKWTHSDLRRGERAQLQGSVKAGNVFIVVEDLEQRDLTPGRSMPLRVRDGWRFFRPGGRYRLEIPSNYFAEATPFGQNKKLYIYEYK